MHSADYAVARWLSVCLFVRLSVLPSVTRRYSVKTAQNVIKLFSRPSSHVILVFAVLLNVMAVFRPGFLTGGVECKGYEKIAIFDKYLATSQKWYKLWPCGMRIGNLTQAFEWYHFQRNWTTPNLNFKVTPVFDAEYLRNSNTRDLHIRIHGCHFEWPWVILSDSVKYLVTQSIARSLYDSWASSCSNVEKLPRKPIRPLKAIENDASARHTNLTSSSCDLDRPLTSLSPMRGRQQLSHPVLRPSSGPNARPQENKHLTWRE